MSEVLEFLSPCPFCGSNNALRINTRDGGLFDVTCERCVATGPLSVSAAQARRTWNERAPGWVVHSPRISDDRAAAGCANDTDGDGDCHLCAGKGGCPIAKAMRVPVVHDLRPGIFTELPHDATELRAWRIFGAEVMPFLEAALAAQGETPDRRLLSLQHSLADLLRSPANSVHQPTPAE